jgi:hypothetical protein
VEGLAFAKAKKASTPSLTAPKFIVGITFLSMDYSKKFYGCLIIVLPLFPVFRFKKSLFHILNKCITPESGCSISFM